MQLRLYASGCHPQNTFVCSGHGWEGKAHTTDVCFFPQGHVGSNVGLQMSPIIMEPSALYLHLRIGRKIVECFAKHAFI